MNLNLMRMPAVDWDRSRTAAPDTIDLWWIDLDRWPASVETLSLEERERAARIRLAGPQRDFIAAHAAVRSILALYLDCRADQVRFRTEANGRPLVASPAPLGFNLSHSGGHALVGVGASQMLGVDCEKVSETSAYMLSALDQIMSEAEASFVEAAGSAPGPLMLYSLWTRKEALAKALGIGLASTLRDVTVVAESIATAVSVLVPGQPRLAVCNIEAPNGFAAAVCAPDPIRFLRVFEALPPTG